MRISLRHLYCCALLYCVCATGLPAQMLNPVPLTIRSHQLTSGPTILLVMTRPGQEDFDGAAQLRTAAGARLAFLYVTNGESVPSERGPWSLPLVAARRKEEAVRSAHAFNARAFFLNLPDIGLDSSALQSSWRLDTLTARMAHIIAAVKPHQILLCTEGGGSRENKEGGLIADAVLGAARLCAQEIPSKGKNTGLSWRVQSIAEARSAAAGPGVTLSALVTKRETGAEPKLMAKAARLSYESLSLSQNHTATEHVGYRILIPADAAHAHSASLNEGIEVASPRLRTVRKAVESAGVSLMKKAVGSRFLVAAAADSVSAYLRQGLSGFTPLDQRALILWKGDLDYLGAKEAEKYVDIHVSDSIITERQVFFVAVRFLRPELRSGTNQIIFQKTKAEDWVFNETSNTVFDLNRDSVFRVLSPEHLSFNTPVALYGLGKETLEDPFRFSVIHQGRTLAESFIITKEVSLRYSSRHASVVQTPVVPIAQQTSVILDSYNFTRDEVDAAIFVKDSVCASDTVRFSLLQKDEHHTDTLHVRWAAADAAASGDRQAEIRGSNHVIGKFTGRKFVLPAPGSKRVVLVSDRPASPLLEYFALAGLPVVKTSSSRMSDALLANADVLLIDRDTPFDYPRYEAAVGRWIRGGGCLVVLPQYAQPAQRFFFAETLAFRSTDLIQARALKAAPEYQQSLVANDGVVRGYIEHPAPSAYEGLITTGDGKLVLARKTYGRGSVIVSAIDLDAWIGRAISGGYDVLAKAAFAP